MPARPRFDVSHHWEERRERIDRMPASPDAGQHDLLNQTIEGEIIPRLMLAVRKAAHGPENPQAVTAEDINELIRLVQSHEADAACAFVETLCGRGVAMQAIFLDLLTPAARALGTMWEEDEVSFTDVTVGLCRLQQVLRHFSAGVARWQRSRSEEGHRALLVPLPGEQHTFGLFMVVEFFRRYGWDVCSAPPQSDNDLRSLIRREHFDVLGFSVSTEHTAESLAPRLASYRKAARNEIAILVGGRTFNSNPGLAEEIGADGTAPDGARAAHTARQILRKRQ